jgi:hypothetical protein
MKKFYTLVLALFIGTATICAEDPQYPNILPTGSFEGITSVTDAGWALWNGNAALMELLTSTNTIDATSTQMLKIVAPTTSQNAWDLQLVTPLIPIVVGYEYSIEFEISSNVAGQGRVSTGNNQLSSQYLPDFSTSTTWKTVTYGPFTAVGTELRLAFDLGYIADVIYYLDNVKVYDHSSTTSIQAPLFKENNTVYAKDGNVNIGDAAGKKIEVLSITGVNVFSAIGNSETVTIPLNKGIYVVVVNDVATKVLVK